MRSFSDFYNEALTVQQRRKRAVLMKRLAPKIALKRKIAMKRKANPEKLKSRSDKAAKNLLRSKLAKTAPYSQLSFAQKAMIDKKLDKKKALISKISKKLLPSIKQKEKVSDKGTLTNMKKKKELKIKTRNEKYKRYNNRDSP